LAFKKVNFDIRGSGTFLTADALFGALRIPVEATTYDAPRALDLLKRGEIAALVHVVGKPARFFETLTARDDLHFVPVPPVAELGETYAAATLTTADYPAMVGPGDPIRTLSVGTVMVAFNWPEGTERHRNVARFVTAFFHNIFDFVERYRHPKWRELDLAAQLPNWERFAPTGGWTVPQAQRRTPASRADGAPGTGSLTAQQREALFRDFTVYQRRLRETAVATSRPDALFQEFLAWHKADSAHLQLADAGSR
jgi:hypothetical protein